MGTGIRYSDEFKQEAVNPVILHGYGVSDVPSRLGINTKSLYKWMQQYSKPTKQRHSEQDLQAELARLKRELNRTQQERNILKEAAVFFASESKYVMGSQEMTGTKKTRLKTGFSVRYDTL